MSVKRTQRGRAPTDAAVDPPAPSVADLRTVSALMQNNELRLAELRLGCLKLAALRRTESTTPGQIMAWADEFLAYVLGEKS